MSFSYYQESFFYQGSGLELVEAFEDCPYLFFLGSSLAEESKGRFSFLGFEPFDTVCGTGLKALESLREKFLRYQKLFQSDSPNFPFEGGCAGVIGYGALSADSPDVVFGFYDCVVIVDHQTCQLHLLSSGLPEEDLVQRQQKAREKLEYLKEKVQGVLRAEPLLPKPPEDFSIKGLVQYQASYSREDYAAMVQQAKEYIAQGEIYQVNLSQRLCCDWNFSQQDITRIFQTLTQVSPSCFGGYFKAGDTHVISSSPERFVSLRGNTLQAIPMKGTRARRHSGDDAAMKDDLLKSEKDQAELLMITDLMRNDLGRVCDYGSVHVSQLRSLEEYATVYQTTSTVEGVLRKGCDAFDVLLACFPGGSVTGCPKIRSMQIIDELEKDPRSFYTGSLGYISFSGDMDFNILIRTMIAKERKICLHVGGGIVADSDPDAEYEETMVKAGAMQACLEYCALSDAEKLETAPRKWLCLNGDIQQVNPVLFDRLRPGHMKEPGMFETMRTSQGRVLDFDAHMARMDEGLRLLGLKRPFSGDEAKDLIWQLMDKLQIQEARARVMVWQGANQVNFSIACQDLVLPPESQYQSGLGLMVSSVVREPSPLSHVKSLDYECFLAAAKEASVNGYDDALLLNSLGEVVESSRANIFFWKDQVLVTPALSSGCLNGVTRSRVIALAKRQGWEVRERNFSLEELFQAEEIFLTNSIIGILPVGRVGDAVFVQTPESRTFQLSALYRQGM